MMLLERENPSPGALRCTAHPSRRAASLLSLDISASIAEQVHTGSAHRADDVATGVPCDSEQRAGHTQSAGASTVGGTPDADRCVIAGGGDLFAVRREGAIAHGIPVSGKGCVRFAVGHAPKPDDAIDACAG